MKKDGAFWNRLVRAYRKAKGFAPLSAAEAQAAYDAAPAVPISAERIKEMVEYATKGREGQEDENSAEARACST